MSTTHDVNREVATSSINTDQPEPRTRKRFSPMVIVSVILTVGISLGVAFILHPVANKAVNGLVGGTSSNGAAPASPSNSETTQPSSTGLNLPTESLNDPPLDVVQYMNGSNGIYLKMFKSDNPGYLPHYFVSASQDGYSRWLSYLQQGVRIYKVALTNVVIDSSTTTGTGTIVAEYDEVDDFHGMIHHVVRYVWSPSSNEWHLYSDNPTPVSP